MENWTEYIPIITGAITVTGTIIIGLWNYRNEQRKLSQAEGGQSAETVESLWGTVEKMDERFNDALLRLATVDKELSDARSRLSELERSERSLKNEVQSLRVRVRELEQERAELVAENRMLRKALDDMDS